MRNMTETERKNMMDYKEAMTKAKNAMSRIMAEADSCGDANCMVAAHEAFADLHTIHARAGRRARAVYSDADAVILGGVKPLGGGR